jgi:perosamine synthetase
MHAVPWWEPRLAGSEDARVRDVLQSGYLNEGDVTAEFERKIAGLLGVPYVIATTSGTSALFLALAALNIGHGDEVIVPDVTFIATANAVVLAGAAPVLADVDRRTLTVDPEEVERAITPRTKAIVPVHVSGRAAAMSDLLTIAGQHSLAIVEDAAEAFLSMHDGRALGTLGRAGCFSFSPNKTITTGQGGVVVTSDAAVHQRLRELKDQGRATRGTGGNDVHGSIGFNFKLTNLQAAVGLAQLEDIRPRLAHQRRIQKAYASAFADIAGIDVLPFRLDEGETPQWTDALADRRDELERYLAQRGIGSRPFWFPLHTQAPYRLPDQRFPNSTDLMTRAIWLPSSLGLTDGDLDLICGHVREFYCER